MPLGFFFRTITMTKYQMKIYRPGVPAPELWITCNIFAMDDARLRN